MKRRELLVTGTTLAIAASGGCTGCARAPTASLRMTETDGLGIARQVTLPLEEAGSPESNLVVDAVENGSTLVNDTEPRFPAERPFVYEGSVYQLTYTTVRSRPARVFQFTLDPAEEEVPESEVIAFDALPAVDREKFTSRGLDEDPFLGFGSTLLYFEPEIPESALVPQPDYPVIEWEGATRGRFTVDGSYETEVKTFRYTSEQVHPSAREFGRSVQDRYEFTLSGLTEGERAIVTEAIEEEHGWVVPPDESPPTALYSLIERFSRQEEVRQVWEDEADRSENPSGSYIVRYEGTLYWTGFSVGRDVLTEAGLEA